MKLVAPNVDAAGQAPFNGTAALMAIGGWRSVSIDVGLNEMVLAFFRVPDRARLMAAYRRKVK